MKTFAAVRALAASGPVAATVRGSSMLPGLADGDRVEIARARFYLPGDVVAFHAGDGRLVVHRLLGYRLYRGRLAGVTRGDAVTQLDAPVPLGQLLGRVVSHPGPAPLAPPRARVAAVGAFLRLVVRRIARIGKRR
ncbi:MAG TPA: S26 family signal peptidase [Thermoanaerobaculia bacterium]|nr:S26 family signal peptidase [Thermoanaerobaculia bacterium]